MATLIRWGLLVTLVAGCGDLVGFGGDAPPFATIHVEATGDFETVRQMNAPDEDLHVALVWGTAWLPEPLCFLPPESPEAATVIADGCRDPLGFTPTHVSSSVPLAPNVPVDLPMFDLPAADLLFGDITARVAYASLVVFDDRDHSGTLELARSRRLPSGGPRGDEGDDPTFDIVYGASFVSMSQPDRRLAFREGAFIETGFYPRHGCEAPPKAFSILGAGGFSFADAFAATVAGTLPSEPAGSCTEDKPDDVTIAIPFRPSPEVREAGCEQRNLDSTVRYRQPPDDPPDFSGRSFACAHIPQLGPDDGTAGVIQLIVASKPDELCRGVSHYTLFGCFETLNCDAPDWDFRSNPPAWWPCPVGMAR